MNIYITFDYELYFGNKTGTVEKCLIEPAHELRRIADKYGARFSFFVDCGYLIRLGEFRKKFPRLEKDYSLLKNQLESFAAGSHDLQLHIHPHWEDSYYDGNEWKIKTQRYKLADFGESEVTEIVSRYKKTLEQYAQNQVMTFRAGGWCIQPFEKIYSALKAEGIKVDSTVFKNGCYFSEQYFYDFRNAPKKSSWKFEKDPLKEDENGSFTEIPISAHMVSPFFYWKLFFLGRWNPHFHKPLGDGIAMRAPGQRFRLLTSFTNQTVSADGYNARLLQKAFNTALEKRHREFTVIGHPKALSRFSLRALDEFIKYNSTHHFTAFSKEFANS